MKPCDDRCVQAFVCQDFHQASAIERGPARELEFD